jgi:hypothetical protein
MKRRVVSIRLTRNVILASTTIQNGIGLHVISMMAITIWTFRMVIKNVRIGKEVKIMIELKSTKEPEVFKPVTLTLTFNTAEDYQMFKRNIVILANEKCDDTDSEFDKLCANILDAI